MSPTVKTLLQLLLVLLSIYPVLYLVVLIHEVGHAVIGRLYGFTVTSFGAGMAKPFLLLNIGRTRFYLCRQNPFQGLTWVLSPDLISSRTQFVMMMLGGILFNLVFGLLFLAFWKFTGALAWILPGGLNLIIGLSNLIPMVVRAPSGGWTIASDGSQALARLRATSHTRAQSPLAILGPRALHEAVGDKAMIVLRLISASGIASDIGDKATAQTYFQEAKSLLPDLPDTPEKDAITAHALLLEGILSTSATEWLSAQELLTDAGNRFRALNRPVGAFVTKVGLTSVTWQLTGDSETALRELNTLASHPLTAKHPSLLAAVYEAWLSLPLETSARETVLARYEALRRRHRFDTTDLRVYSSVARARQTEGDSGGALLAFTQAIEAAQAVYVALQSDSGTQQRFADRIRETLLPEAIASAESLGKSTEAKAWQLLFPSAEEAQKQRTEAEEKAQAIENKRQQKESRRLRLALQISGFLFGLGAIGFASRPGTSLAATLPRPVVLALFLTFLVAVFHAILLISLLVSQIVVNGGKWESLWKGQARSNVGSQALLFTIGLSVLVVILTILVSISMPK